MTDKFNAFRLTVARQRRAMTKTELALRCGVTVQAITGYEGRTFSPSPEMLLRMAAVLGYPLSFFCGPTLPPLQLSETTFRSLRTTSARLRDRALASGTLVASLIEPMLYDRFKRVPLDVPDVPGASPAEAADLLRVQWGLGVGPIDNMVVLLESKGVQVFWMSEEESKIDAFAFWHGDVPFVFLNPEKGTGDRQRFNAAHELAHLVLHRHVPNPPDRDIEREAHAFAAAFLLPAAQFEREAPRVADIDEFRPVKRRWKVSIAAMVRRCRDLGLLTRWQYEDAVKEIGRRGWRTREPVEIDHEDSRLHRLMFERFVTEGVGPRRLAELLDLDVEQILEFMPVAHEFLDREELARRAHQQRMEGRLRLVS